MTVQTQEFAKNPDIPVLVKCTICQKEYDLSTVLHEEKMPTPNELIVEGYLLCPSCGDRKHAYYLTEQLRFLQVELKKALDRYHLTKSTIAWREYARKQKSFQDSYDAAQKRLLKKFREEVVP